MLNLEAELTHEIEWRTSELSMIKTIPIMCKCTEKQKEILEKYSVVAIYSIWEGFVVESFSHYLREINNLNLACRDLHLNILTHDIFIKYGLNDEQRKHFSHKVNFVSNVLDYTENPVTVSPQIPTESNVDFKVINKILEHFNLDLLPERDFKNRLEKLLFYRNNIAHGECSVVMNQDLIKDFNLTVIDSMHEITFRILEGLTNEKYLNQQ